MAFIIDCTGGVTEETNTPFTIVYHYYCSAKKDMGAFDFTCIRQIFTELSFHFKSSLKGNSWGNQQIHPLYAVEVPFISTYLYIQGQTAPH